MFDVTVYHNWYASMLIANCASEGGHGCLKKTGSANFMIKIYIR